MSYTNITYYILRLLSKDVKIQFNLILVQMSIRQVYACMVTTMLLTFKNV